MGHHGGMFRVALVGGIALLAIAFASAVWPQRTSVDGQSRACPVAIAFGLPTDPPLDAGDRAVYLACEDHDEEANHVAVIGGFFGVSLLVCTWLLRPRRDLRIAQLPPPPNPV